VFWEVTVDYQDALVRALRQASPDAAFCLFSAQGADPSEKSPIRFAKAKGRAEKHLLDAGFETVYILRPGFIDPPGRWSDLDWMAKIFRPIYRLLPGIGVGAIALGQALVKVGTDGWESTILENKAIRQLALKESSE
jgi:uncharacterized protein YbjT (DUF2867 family)